MVTTAARAEHLALPARVAARFAPLGVPLTVDVETAAQLDAVSRALRCWEGDPAAHGCPLRLRLTESASGDVTGSIEMRVNGHHLELFGPGVQGTADAVARRAECRVNNAYLGDAERFRDDVLDPLLLFMLTRNGRLPVHAAGFVADGLAVLLAGPSGSGKSCLALAAARAGYPVLSDDTVYVQLEPRLRLWGLPRPLHLYPADASGDATRLRLRNGKLKQAVHLPTACIAAERAVLCVLARGERPSLRRISPARARDKLHRLEPGFDLLAEEVRAAHAALTRNGAWLLRLSADPAEAIRLVTCKLDDLRATAVPKC